MELKSVFGKYKAKEVDLVIKKLQQEKSELKENLEKRISDLENENNKLKSEIEKCKEKEGIIAQVMLDATQRAKEIEDDYRTRAKQSDDACKQLHNEWITGMQSAAANLNRLKNEAKEMLNEIDSQFSSLCSWADNKLESLEKASLPETSEEISINAEINSGANADLGELCREMGIFDENASDNSESDSENAESPFENNSSTESENNEIADDNISSVKDYNVRIPIERAVEKVEEKSEENQ